MRHLLPLFLCACAAKAAVLPDGPQLAQSRLALPPIAIPGAFSVTTASDAATLTGAVGALLGAGAPRGLRVVGTYALPVAAVDPAFWEDWAPVPLPPDLVALEGGPAELVTIPGFYRCRALRSSPGSDSGWASSPCEGALNGVDAYEVAVYDPTVGQLTVVIKEYF